MNANDEWVVVRVIRSRVGDTTYPDADAAAKRVAELAMAFPGRQYALAHVSFPTEGQVES